MQSRLLAAAGALACLVAAPSARADLIRLIDGRTIEGKVTRTGGRMPGVSVKGYRKTSTYADSEVKFVEAGECTWDVAARMQREIPPDASDALFVDGHLKVARYLEERRVYCPDIADLVNREWEAVLRKSPENAEAHAGLHHVKWGQWWFKGEAEREKFRKGAPAAQMEPLGYVKYKKTGLWETKEDVEAQEAGKVKYKGRWMTADEKKEAEGYVKDEGGKWVLKRDIDDRKRREEVEAALKEKPVTVTSSKHFRLISWLNANETAQMKELAEKTYAEHRALLGIPVPKDEEGGDDLFPDPIDAFLLVDGGRKENWVKVYGKTFGWSDEIINHRVEKGASWHDLNPYAYILVSGKKAEKNRQRDADDDIANARSTVTSEVGRLVLDRVRGGNMPPWLYEANAFLAEIRENETANDCHSTMTKYREEVANKQGSKAKYFEFMKQQIGAGLDRPLRQIFTLALNDLDWADSVKSWSFLEFLVANHLEEFHTLVKAPVQGVDEILPAHVEAAVLARKPKDPSAIQEKPKKEDAPLPTAPIKVRGAGAQQVTEGSPEERAIAGASSEQWLEEILKKDIKTLEADWKAWIVKHD